MRKLIITLALVFSVNAVYAGDGDWKSWYGNMLKGLRTRVEKKLSSKTRVSAVAAVRGAKQGSDPKALYWKGSVSDAAQKKLEAERKQLGDAVQLVLDGDIAGGRAALQKFIKDNPDSVFMADAKDALSKLPADAQPAAAAAPQKEEAPAAQAPAPEEKPAAPEEKPSGKPAN